VEVVFVKPIEPTPYPSDGVSPLRWLPPEGARVRDSNYWRRRAQEGAVTITTALEAAPPPPSAKTEEA